MARENNGNVKLAKIVVPIIVAILLATTLGISKWTVEKTVDLDKELGTLHEVNETEHNAFEKADQAILREQRSLDRKMDRRLDKIDQVLYKVAAKLEVDTP